MVPTKVYDSLIKSNLVLFVSFKQEVSQDKCIDFDFCLVSDTPCD